MAKKSSKSSLAASGLGGILPKGEAALIKRAFNARMLNSGATNLPEIPDAACLTVKELRIFLNEVEKMVNPNPAKPVPENEIGVAIMPAFRKNKITFMLVATRFREDKSIQKVIAINNAVSGIHRGDFVSKTVKAKKSKLIGGDEDPNEPPVGDLALDTISTHP